MPGLVAPITDEKEGLLAYLAQQRLALRAPAYGLTEEQVWSTPSVSAMSLGGLVKHAADVEQGWIVETLAQRELSNRDYHGGFHRAEGETLADVLAFSDRVANETEAIIAATSLDQPVPVPQGVPWFPDDVDAWSARWVLLHLIEETARHGGHADIIRETLDGASFYELLAAAEA